MPLVRVGDFKVLKCKCFWLHVGFRVLPDQQSNQRTQQPFATHFHVVNELEETEITWQFFLGNATVGS